MSAPRAAKRNGHRPTPQDFIARRIARTIERETLGLGHWKEPRGWGAAPFSHTVTVASDAGGYMDGWQIYNSGVMVALDVQSLDGPFDRGAPYVWCKAAHNRNGTTGVYPTAPLFGRFIEHTGRGPKVLSGRGQSAVIGSEYAYCFRAVGGVHSGSEFFTRSEIPVPIPSKAVRQDGPHAFDYLQHQAKRLDGLLLLMSDVVDMTDVLAEAPQPADASSALNDKLAREARSYRLLEALVASSLQQSGHATKGMADYLKASPELGHWLARWQADDKA